MARPVGDARPRSRRGATRLLAGLAVLGGVAGCVVGPPPPPPPPSCDGITVDPGPSAATAFADALVRASAAPSPSIIGPAGRPQGRVHLGAGTYDLSPVVVPSDVRIEIDPGATVRVVRGTRLTAVNDWGLFTFGSDAGPTTNTTIVAGDGCGGPGRPTASNKPTSTAFRGNDPAAGGMANEPVPATAAWDTDRLWVLDLDPAATGVGVQVTGFHVRWALDVELGDVLTIQNASRQPTGIGPVAGSTSRTVAMMFDPLDGSAFTPVVADQRLPHRVEVHDHYNILSPSGQGPNQIRACRDCTFTHVFSHGGVALRVETDGIRTIGTDCTATGADGQGFREFAIVDGLRARDIQAIDANRVVMFTPHCLPNGTATVDGVRGWGVGELVSMVPHQADGPAGGFRSVVVSDVAGCGGAAAQQPYPAQDSYLLGPSRAAVQVTAPYGSLAGSLAWPAPPAAGGLPDGVLPAGGGFVLTHPAGCPR